MWITGNLVKQGKLWAVAVPCLEDYTQGRTKKEAYEMAKDMLEQLAKSEGFEGLTVAVRPLTGDTFLAGSKDTKRFTAFVLRRWRKAHNLTLAQAARRLGISSQNAYARYEKGLNEPTLSQMERLVSSIAPGEPMFVAFGAPAGTAA
ncbi:MAG: helix-turn-helix transcriptional regulator [Nitrospinae bacterium]|nr:helix-turn-helix transcriptional regulator [Nitrospinota bacterium]